jgi:hypothetical protein
MRAEAAPCYLCTYDDRLTGNERRAPWAKRDAGLSDWVHYLGHQTLNVVESLPAGAAYGGIKLLREATNVAKHHIFPRQFRKWFASKGLNIDKFTVQLAHETTHLKGVHGRGLGNMPGGWNSRWAEFIEKNPNPTLKEVYQFGGKLLDEYGLSHIPIVPY